MMLCPQLQGSLTDYPFLLAWGEDVRIEANIKGRAADGANRLAGIADHLSASRVYCGDGRARIGGRAVYCEPLAQSTLGMSACLSQR